MALNRDEKDFLTQLAAAQVQASGRLLAAIKAENEIHIGAMKKISGHEELIGHIDRLEREIKRLERQNIVDRIVLLFRTKDVR